MVRLQDQTIEQQTYMPALAPVIIETYPTFVYRNGEQIVLVPTPKRAFDKTRFDDHLNAGLSVSRLAGFILTTDMNSYLRHPASNFIYPPWVV